MKDVAVYVPTRGQVQCETVMRLAPYAPVYVRDGGYNAGSVRNQVVRDFLATDAAVLVMVDDDVWPMEGFVEELVAVDGFDVVAGAAPVASAISSRGHICAPAYRLDQPLSSLSGTDWTISPVIPDASCQAPVEVDAVGAGCLLIHRRVLEHQEMEQPFRQGYDRHGVVCVSTDIAFSLRARRAGYRIAMHFGVVCDHRINTWARGLMRSLGLLDGGVLSGEAARTDGSMGGLL